MTLGSKNLRLISSLGLGLVILGCSSEAPRRPSGGRSEVGGSASLSASSGGSSTSLVGGDSSTLGSGGRANTGGSPAGGRVGLGSGGVAPMSGTGGRSFQALGGKSNAGIGGSSATAGSGGATVGSGGGMAIQCGNASFCDDFEGPAPGQNGSAWTLQIKSPTTGTTSVEVVSTKAHSGTKSVHVAFPQTAQLEGVPPDQSDDPVIGYIAEMQSFPVANNSFWGRAWFWFATGDQQAHVVHIEARGPRAGGADDGLRVAGTTQDLLVTNLESTDDGAGSTVHLTQGKWVCYEWYLGAGMERFFVDGTEIGELSSSFSLPTFNLLRLGFQRWAAGPSGELWLDDVAVGDARVGCQ